VRVIAGRYGGRRLQAPRGRATRPTSDRVREALFSMLGDVQETIVLDLFAGTGALGIEALSRGAARAVFVEQNPAALQALKANLSALELDKPATQLLPANVGKALRSARERHETYDLIFVDPPYDDARAWARELSVALPPLLAPHARVVVESDRRALLELDAPELETEQQRRYGDTTITIHRHTKRAEGPGSSACGRLRHPLR
jgi:16S rRNA (guanine966-N2)-methyltransferase